MACFGRAFKGAGEHGVESHGRRAAFCNVAEGQIRAQFESARRRSPALSLLLGQTPALTLQPDPAV